MLDYKVKYVDYHLV